MVDECKDFCNGIEEICLENCDGNESCNFDCGFDTADCIYHCPCYPGCLSGCDECDSSFCQCSDYESNSDFLACQSYFEDIYISCIVGCKAGDVQCLTDCARDLDLNMLECPCMKNCPYGCPCDNYQCQQTTTQTTTTTTASTTLITTTTTTTTTTANPNTSILILSTRYYNTKPVLTDSTGQTDTNLGFTYDEDAIVHQSCSVTFKNQHFVYGGNDNYSYRQISRIDGCQLRRIGDLSFDLNYATCTTVGNDRIYFCFTEYKSTDRKKCRYATDPEGPFFDIPESNKEHRLTRIAASSSKNSKLRISLQTCDLFQPKYWQLLVTVSNQKVWMSTHQFGARYPIFLTRRDNNLLILM